MAELTIPSADDDLVFICGALRSGTTLLRLMINDHPALSNPGEMDFLFEPPPVQGGRRDMAAYAHDLSVNRVFKAKQLKVASRLDYEEQVRDFIRQLRKPGKRLSINIHRHFDRVPAIFPDARFVHLLRDPRDVAKSSIGMGWAGNVYHGVDHWIASERDFEKLTAMVPAGRIHGLKNEDLLHDPKAELTRLCAFLGVAYDARMLDYPSHTTYEAPDPRLAEQWRTGLNPRDIALVEGKVAAMLTARGYPPSGEKPVVPDPAEAAALRRQNRLGRIRFSVRRNGVILTALDLVTRRLGIKSVHDLVRQRLAAREAQFLK